MGKDDEDDFEYTTTDLSHRDPDRFKKTNESAEKPSSSGRRDIREEK